MVDTVTIASTSDFGACALCFSVVMVDTFSVICPLIIVNPKSFLLVKTERVLGL